MIEQQKGSAALVAMLTAYRDGLDTPAVFAKVLGMKPEEVDKQFDTWVRAKFAVPLRSITASDGKGEVGGAFVSTMRSAMAMMTANQLDSAKAAFQRAQALFPEYAGASAPALMLAKIAFDRGDFRGALDAGAARDVAQRDGVGCQPARGGSARRKLGDSSGARAPLERHALDIALRHRDPYSPCRARDAARGITRRRCGSGARWSHSIHRIRSMRGISWRVRWPTRVMWLVRERSCSACSKQAPSFEKAQTLLLELSTRGKS